MRLAKPALDFGLFTTRPEALRDFWEGEVGLPFNHILPIGPGRKQHRFDLPGGSMLKVNAVADLVAARPGGYRALAIARDGLSEPQALADPDGNRLLLVPTGWRGVTQIAVLIAVTDLAAHRRFYGETLGLPALGEGFAAGASLVLAEEDPSADPDSGIQGGGWRYTTLQIFDCRAEHAGVLARGGREGAPPFKAGEVAVFSMVRDPDGNWIELSQRASIVGPLD